MGVDEPRKETGIVRFGLFEADVKAGELRREGQLIKLQDQPFRLLVLLLEHAGEVVTREELRAALWPDGTLVDFEYGVNTAIKKLRQALGDSADNPIYIQTLPRRGYRLIAPVSADAPVGQASGRTARPGWVVAAVVLLLLVAGGAWWLVRRSVRQTSGLPVPLVAYAGSEFGAAFSPDGSQMAFTWSGVQEDNYDIYVKRSGSDTAVRLTTDRATDFSPVWSPDGRRIAFLRHVNGNHFDVMMAPAAGGPEAKVGESSAVPFPYSRELAFSPDGKWLLAPDGHPPAGARSVGLALYPLEGGARRLLTTPPAGYSADTSPAFSPDGRALAFIRESSPQVRDLWVVALNEDLTVAGEPRRLTSWNRTLLSPAWGVDGSEIIVATGEMQDAHLWRIPVWSGEAPSVIEAAGEGATLPAFSPDGRLIFTRTQWNSSLWVLDLSTGSGERARPRRWAAASSRNDFSPRFSPDGRRVVFVSNRSGSNQIWVANRDGSGAFQATSLAAPFLGSPSWSPDGSTIVFDGTVNGRFEIFTVSAAGGEPRRLVGSSGHDGAASYSRDGRWIYFASNRSGRFQIWRMPAQGGTAVQWTHNGGRVARESADGKDLYFVRIPQPGMSSLWRMPATGGTETHVLDAVLTFSFDVARDGVYFISRDCRAGQCPVCYYEFASGRAIQIDEIAVQDSRGLGLSVAPDGKSLLLSHATGNGADLMVLDRFR